MLVIQRSPCYNPYVSWVYIFRWYHVVQCKLFHGRVIGDKTGSHSASALWGGWWGDQAGLKKTPVKGRTSSQRASSYHLQPPLVPTSWPCLSLEPASGSQEWLLQLGLRWSLSSHPGWRNGGISSRINAVDKQSTGYKKSSNWWRRMACSISQDCK